MGHFLINIHKYLLLLEDILSDLLPIIIVKPQLSEHMNLTAIIEKDEFGFSAFIKEISGVNTQGEDLEEVRSNLEDALSVVAEIKGIHTYKITKEEFIDKSTTIHTSC